MSGRSVLAAVVGVCIPFGVLAWRSYLGETAQNSRGKEADQNDALLSSSIKLHKSSLELSNIDEPSPVSETITSGLDDENFGNILNNAEHKILELPHRMQVEYHVSKHIPIKLEELLVKFEELELISTLDLTKRVRTVERLLMELEKRADRISLKVDLETMLKDARNIRLIEVDNLPHFEVDEMSNYLIKMTEAMHMFTGKNGFSFTRLMLGNLLGFIESDQPRISKTISLLERNNLFDAYATLNAMDGWNRVLFAPVVVKLKEALEADFHHECTKSLVAL